MNLEELICTWENELKHPILSGGWCNGYYAGLARCLKDLKETQPKIKQSTGLGWDEQHPSSYLYEPTPDVKELLEVLEAKSAKSDTKRREE